MSRVSAKSVSLIASVCAGLAVLTAAGLSHAEAKDICWREGPTQFVDGTTYCVSSVLSPQGKRDYGPRNLVGYYGTSGAWCEGAKGDGVGETIVVSVERGPAFRQLLIRNGYGRSEKSFRDNGRLKQVRITSDTGMDVKVQLRDLPQEQVIRLPKVGNHRWIRLEILAVYPGARYSDTCVTALGPDFVHEEELLARQQEAAPQRPAEPPSLPAPQVPLSAQQQEGPPTFIPDTSLGITLITPDVAKTPEPARGASEAAAPPTETFDIDAAIALSNKEVREAGDPELTLWNRIKFSEKPADVESYLSRYPAGAFATIARRRLQQLQLQQQAATRR